jgi:predicted enzyme related to lactoylglutathione lyase
MGSPSASRPWRQLKNTIAGGEGRWIEIVLWTDDTDAALNALAAHGTPILSPAHDFLDGQLRAAWIADPDGNPVQLVQRND